MRVITGSARGRKLKTPDGGDIVRPTTDRVKEALFSIIQFKVPSSRALDLFCGSGQLGIEALSRGADSAVFIDKSPVSLEITKENLKTVKLFEKAVVINTDSVEYVKYSKDKFDLIFLDPPYKSDLIIKVLPYLSALCADGAYVICETEYTASLPECVGELHRAKEYKYSKTKLTTYIKD